MNGRWLWLQLAAACVPAAIQFQVVLSGLVYHFALVVVSEQLGEFVWAGCSRPWRVIFTQLAVSQNGGAATVNIGKSLLRCNLCRSYQVVLNTFDCVSL